MNNLYRDRRFHFIIAANILSSIGSGITMIAIPWLLVSEVDGAKIFGYFTIAMTTLNFFITPLIGQLVDRLSRKRILLFGEMAGFIFVLVFAGLGFFVQDYELWHYAILYGTGSLYYNLFYPTIFAFNQEIFDSSVYSTLNGAMEIQGQLSSVIAGAVASILIVKVDLQWLLFLDAFTYLSAFFLLWGVPYIKHERKTLEVSVQGKITEGFRYIRKQPLLFWYLLASLMPFIGVMMTNYLFPVYLESVLKTDASVYGMQSMIYGLGAVAAGILIPSIARKWGNQASIVTTVFIYTLAISTIVFVKAIPVYFLLTILLAFGNSGTRVARNSFIMEVIPNSIVGRVDSLFRAMGLFIRILLISVFTQFVGNQHFTVNFYILGALLIISLMVLIIVNRLISNPKERSIQKAVNS